MKTGFFKILLACIVSQAAFSQSDKELMMKLNNPVALLVSVPFQFNYDSGIGQDKKGEKYYMNIQPIVPFILNDNYKLISRTIMPVIAQKDIFSGSGRQSGIGDITQSFFIVPNELTEGGWTIGAGPVILLPTASDKLLGSGKWGAGPTAVMVKEDAPWTYGMLVNHIWSFAGEKDRTDFSVTLMQPFVSYVDSNSVTYSINTETTYEWRSDTWTAPVNIAVSKIFRFGKQPVNLGAALRYHTIENDASPKGFGIRLFATFVFPK